MKSKTRRKRREGRVSREDRFELSAVTPVPIGRQAEPCVIRIVGMQSSNLTWLPGLL